ncbi:MAG: hypothetical protein ACKVOG_05005 [Rhodoglobus sp.]
MTAKPMLVVGGEPRVNLLPPEVAQRKKARSARRGLVALVILVLLAVAGGYAFAAVQVELARAELAAAQARTAELLGEQLKYSEVTAVGGQVLGVTSARTVAVSTEVLWNDLYKLIRDRLPEGTTLASLIVDGRAPWEPEPVPAGPLRQPRVATVTFVISSPGPIAIEPFVAKIADLDGFADITPDVVERSESLYSTTFTYNLTMDALSGRFAAGEDGSN